MKMKKGKKKSLFYKICAAMILTGMLPLILINGIWLHNTSNIVYKNEIQTASSMLYQLSMRMENIMNFVNTCSYSFLFDTKARAILSVKPKSEEEREKNETYIKNIFSQIKKNNTMIRSLEFDGKYYQISSEDTADFEMLQQYDWYQDFVDYYLEGFSPVYCNSYIERMNTPVFGWIRKVTYAKTSDIAGNFLIEIAYSSIRSLAEEIQDDMGNSILVFDKKGNLIFHPEGRFSTNEAEKKLFQRIKSGENEIALSGGGEKYTCLVTRVSTPQWYIAMLVNEKQLMAYGKQSTMQSMILGILILIAGIVLAYMISRHITRPVKQLAETMELVEKNYLDVSVPTDQKIVELEILSKGFNNMLSHIQQLLEDVRAEEQEKKALEIKMLQAQINPHFLYNILNVIRWKAMMHGEKSISNMIVSLIKLLEFSGKRVNTFVPIEKELEHASSYLDLIKSQYQDDFDVIYEVDPEALPCYTVKFLLQPLVENAVFHGLEPMEGKGKIFIGIKKAENWIHFQVKDNGVGMSEEMQRNQSAFRGLGTYNVNERLKKHFGEASMLNIESQPGEGTKIFFKIPVITEAPLEEGEKENGTDTAGGR